MIGHAIDHLEIEDKWHLKIAIDAFGSAFSSRLVQALRVAEFMLRPIRVPIHG